MVENWIEQGESPYPYEREALAWVRKWFPQHEPWRAIADLATTPLEFDAQAFRPLAEKLKFFEALPEPRVGQLCEARYDAREALRAILAEDCRSVTIAP